jgi:hypothetical protein
MSVCSFVHFLQILVQLFLADCRSFKVFFDIFFFLRHLIRGFKYVNSICCTTDHQLIENWMKSNLLYLFLSLVNKHQFIRYLRIFLLVFHRYIPDWNLIILTSNCNNGLLIRLESYRSNGLSMPLESN